ncbi:hypothetical protein [Bdellovibrio bacteriovorus]|uniref:hypothetical protein n=1 Tax=Bdellovibrio bacteriovorus TaxID=959 RepID=UPI00059F260D|nr:hypothetical protein [Bdellovibrio bacteriovorus]
MKKTILAFLIPVVAGSLAHANFDLANSGKVFAVCNKVIDSNVNGTAKDTLLEAGEVLIVEYDNYYTVEYDYTNLKFSRHGSIQALASGCRKRDIGLKFDTYSPCQENERTLKMQQSFVGGDSPRILALFNKETDQLRVTLQSQPLLFYKTMSDVVLQCSRL